MQTAGKREKVSRSAFEQKLTAICGTENLSREPYDEISYVNGEPRKQRLTLYYRNTAKPDKYGLDYAHFATWTNGEGWIFEGFDADVEWK